MTQRQPTTEQFRLLAIMNADCLTNTGTGAEFEGMDFSGLRGVTITEGHFSQATFINCIGQEMLAQYSGGHASSAAAPAPITKESLRFGWELETIRLLGKSYEDLRQDASRQTVTIDTAFLKSKLSSYLDSHFSSARKTAELLLEASNRLPSDVSVSEYISQLIGCIQMRPLNDDTKRKFCERLTNFPSAVTPRASGDRVEPYLHSLYPHLSNLCFKPDGSVSGPEICPREKQSMEQVVASLTAIEPLIKTVNSGCSFHVHISNEIRRNVPSKDALLAMQYLVMQDPRIPERVRTRWKDTDKRQRYFNIGLNGEKYQFIAFREAYGTYEFRCFGNVTSLEHQMACILVAQDAYLAVMNGFRLPRTADLLTVDFYLKLLALSADSGSPATPKDYLLSSLSKEKKKLEESIQAVQVRMTQAETIQDITLPVYS